jgi:tetratricopeptide (TPR) repeat protein
MTLNCCINIRLVTILVFAIFIFSSCKDDVQSHFSSGRAVMPEHFTGSESCKECHEEEYNLWMGSHHQLAMQIASDSTVLGDFDNTLFKSKGIRYHFFRQNGDFIVNTIGDDGAYHNFAIKYTFGFVPLQQYIVEFENGNHQCLLVAWDTDSLRWFDLQPELDIHHEEWMHWTGGSMTWNNMCADCHSTYVRKNYYSSSKTYRTEFTEISVGCESCHGPGDLHNEYYLNEDKYQGFDPPQMHMPAGMSSVEIVDACARCHSRRSMFTEVFDYDGRFLDHYYPNLLHFPTYEKDGQILDEDYVYGSFKQSKMYHNKVSCRDCHDMHSLELRFQGNQLCLLCHLPSYNSKEHHFHEMDTEASQCINCHMTGKYYMGNDFRRDHSFRNPRPDQSLLYGTPNACTGCHEDQTNAWAADFIIQKYGSARPDHFSNRLLPGLNGNMDSLKSLLLNRKMPEIARATAVLSYASQVDEQDELALLKELLKDSSAMVRRESAVAIGDFGFPILNEELDILLSDSVRAVRIAAARYFVLNGTVPVDEGFEKARDEYFTDLEVNADFASGNHQWALYHQSRGDADTAISFYEEALRIDNYYNASRMNLALLVFEKGDVQKAESLYLKVIEQEPDYSYPWFMLGLLYNETEEQEKSLNYLKGACEREPFIVRAHYNYALKLQENRMFEKADLVLEKAIAAEPEDESLLYVRALGLKELNRLAEAIKIAEKLVLINPGNQIYIRLKQSLQ